MRFEELEFNIMKWANNKDLLTKDNEYQQYAKFLEEGTEILVAINKLNKIRAKASDLDMTDNFQVMAHNQELNKAEIELMDAYGDTLVTLIISAVQHDLLLLPCLELAWNEIKNRTGKTVNGTFIKDK